MKIRSMVQPAVFLLIIGALASGCGGSHGDHAHAHNEEHGTVEEGITFSESKGLSVPRKTADYIGLKVVDVEEQEVASTFRFNAKVYRPSATTTSSLALASGFVRKTEVEQLKLSQNVKIEVDGTQALTGKVAALNRAMETVNGQVEVLLQIHDPQKSLVLGSSVEAVVPTGKEETVVSVPRTALLRTAEGNFVYTVSGEHLVRSEIEVGDSSNEVVEVTEGLYAGDQVVANPVMTLWMAELQSIRGGASCADGH